MRGGLTSLPRCDTLRIVAIELTDILSLNEARESLNIGRMTLWRWIHDGKITCVKVGGRNMILKSEVERINREKNEQAAEPAA